MLSFLCCNPMPCDLCRSKLFCCAEPSVWGWGEGCVVISDQILGADEQPIRQSWSSHISVHCTSSFRKGQGCNLLAHVLLLGSGLQTCSHVLVVLQAGCKMNHWPCLLGKSQTHPHITAQQQEPHPCPVQGRLVAAQSCLQGHKHHSHQPGPNRDALKLSNSLLCSGEDGLTGVWSHLQNM